MTPTSKIKRNVITTGFLLSPLLTFSQSGKGSGNTEIMIFAMNAIAILLSIWIASSFLLTLVRLFLNNRLRRTLIERNASPEVISEIMPTQRDHAELALKYCCIFTAAGAGLTVCYYTQPLGLHSAIILSFAVALGLLAYYLISKRQRS